VIIVGLPAGTGLHVAEEELRLSPSHPDILDKSAPLPRSPIASDYTGEAEAPQISANPGRHPLSSARCCSAIHGGEPSKTASPPFPPTTKGLKDYPYLLSGGGLQIRLSEE